MIVYPPASVVSRFSHAFQPERRLPGVSEGDFMQPCRKLRLQKLTGKPLKEEFRSVTELPWWTPICPNILIRSRTGSFYSESCPSPPPPSSGPSLRSGHRMAERR